MRRSSSRLKPPQPAIFVVVTHSPPWSIHSDRTDDYLVEDQHLLLELAPRPREVWYTSTNKNTKYVDLVCTDDDGVISFTSDVDVYGTASGLTIDFTAGIAALRSVADTEERYVEIALGPHAEPQRLTPAADWESKMVIDRIEVYDASRGVYEDAIVERQKGDRRVTVLKKTDLDCAIYEYNKTPTHSTAADIMSWDAEKPSRSTLVQPRQPDSPNQPINNA